MGITATVGAVAAGASIASVGLGAGASVAAGEGKAEELRTKSQNYLLEGEAKYTNYLLEGEAKATNYELEGAAKSTNYELEGQSKSANFLYQGAAQKAQYGAEASNQEMQAKRAERSAETGRVQANLTDATMRDSLTRTLGNIAVIRSAGRTDFASATTAAVSGAEERRGNMQREASLVSIHKQVAEDEAAGAYLHKAAGFSTSQGEIAERMGQYNAEVATKFAAYNANTTRKYADYNSKTARQYARYNADVTKQYALLNADAAKRAAGTASSVGWLEGGAKLLGGLGKMGGA